MKHLGFTELINRGYVRVYIHKPVKRDVTLPSRKDRRAGSKNKWGRVRETPLKPLRVQSAPAQPDTKPEERIA